MKTKLIITAIVIAVFLTSCVQKTYKKTVIFTLDASAIKNIKKVGIRGNDKPLSWDYDTEMKVINKDSIYQITATFETGYKFTEVKFAINDKIELEGKENRKIYFDSKTDTTKVAIIYDKNTPI